jgi:hypothetical protein
MGKLTGNPPIERSSSGGALALMIGLGVIILAVWSGALSAVFTSLENWLGSVTKNNATRSHRGCQGRAVEKALEAAGLSPFHSRMPPMASVDAP